MTEPTAPRQTPPFSSFDEFWPYYVGEHLNPVTRWMHFAGTTAAMATLGVAAVTRKPSLALLAAVMGYGPAWASHFFVEHNRPATFRHPIWSLQGDLVMWKKMIDGSMNEEIAKVLRSRGAREAEAAKAHDEPPSAEAPSEPAKRVRVEDADAATTKSALGEPPLNGVAR